MAIILKAAPLISRKTEQFKKIVKNFNMHGVRPSLKVLVAGEDTASKVYVEHKMKKCIEIGADCEIIRFANSVNEADIEEKILSLNNDPGTHGILVQLPLPVNIKNNVGLLISKLKDVDGFTPDNTFELYRGSTDGYYHIPCTPKGIIELLKFYKIDIAKKKVLILGRSTIVGKPMMLLALKFDAAPTIIHSKIKNITDFTKTNDVIISAIGQPNMLDNTHFRSDGSQIIVDVGINRLKNGQLAGDIDFNLVHANVAAITPVPGGVGPMTVICLIENLLFATAKQHNLNHLIAGVYSDNI